MAVASAARALSEIASEQANGQRDYSGFPWWHALLVPPNHEQKSADWLHRVRVFVYWPTFSRKICRRGHVSMRRQCAVLPGMLFVPREMIDFPRRDEVFGYAEVHGFIRNSEGGPSAIGKPDIEMIRLLEAKLNLPPEAKGVFFKVGQEVRFGEDSILWGWRQGTIFEIADETRIGVEVPGLFGRATRVYVPASEIEAM